MTNFSVDPLIRAVCAAQPRGHYFPMRFGENKTEDDRKPWNHCVRCNVAFHELSDQEAYACINGYSNGIGAKHEFIRLTPDEYESIVSTLGSEEKGS